MTGYYAGAPSIPADENRTVAKVYDPEGSGDKHYRGNAFVVDGPLGLLVTAEHVAEEAVESRYGASVVGAKLDLVFNDFEGGTNVRTKATVRAVLGDEIGSPRENHPRDLALLQVDEEALRGKLRERRVAIGPATTEFREATVQSYFANLPSMTVDDGSFGPDSFPDDSSAMTCTYRFAYRADGGDSGAPLLDARKALTLGVLLERASDKEKSYGVVLPSSCMREPLVTWMERLFATDVAAMAELLLNADQTRLALMLRNPDDPERPTNARLHAAIRKIASMTIEDRERWRPNESLGAFFDRRSCIIDRALVGREAALPSDDRKRFESAWLNLSLHLARIQTTSAADTLLQRAQVIQFTDPVRSREMAVLASLAYAETIGLEVPSEDLSLDAVPEFFVVSSSFEAAISRRPETDVARRFKGISDSLMLAANLSEDDSFRTPALATARGAALQAVWLARDEAPAIAANSLIA